MVYSRFNRYDNVTIGTWRLGSIIGDNAKNSVVPCVIVRVVRRQQCMKATSLGH